MNGFYNINQKTGELYYFDGDKQAWISMPSVPNIDPDERNYRDEFYQLAAFILRVVIVTSVMVPALYLIRSCA